MSLIKIAVLGAGFARLQQLGGGLAEKALQQHAGSDWLKDAAKKVVAPGISEISGLQRKVLPSRLSFLAGKTGGQVSESLTGAGKFTTPFSALKKVAAERVIKLPISHIKEDGKEFNEILEFSNKINKIISNMKNEDKKAMGEK